MSNIESLQSLANDSELLLFDLTNFNKSSPFDQFSFTANDGVVFGGISYLPLACTIDGLEVTNAGQLPTPTLSVSDATTEDSLIISGLVDFYGGLEGSWITIRQVLRMNLDDGIAPNPAATKPVQKFQISHVKEMVPGVGVSFELTTPLELLETRLPTQLALTKCPWRYRFLLECPYASNSAEWDVQGNPVPVGSPLAACGKTLKDCRLRFPSGALPTGAFPSLTRIG
jgi:lambda family phage minor tail protein L